MDKKTKAKKILDVLEGEFPNPKTALDFSNPLELLVATVLSAQCTDERVNKTTKALFKKYRTAADYANSPEGELEESIKNINFFRNKAKSIRSLASKLVAEFSGEVRASLYDLTSLSGVGRKTANVVLGNAFGREALAVDTHVKRVTRRLGLAQSEDPELIEEELTAVIPSQRWTKATHLLILHGRKTCKARGPRCEECGVCCWCDFFEESSLKDKKAG